MFQEFETIGYEYIITKFELIRKVGIIKNRDELIFNGEIKRYLLVYYFLFCIELKTSIFKTVKVFNYKVVVRSPYHFVGMCGLSKDSNTNCQIFYHYSSTKNQFTTDAENVILSLSNELQKWIIFYQSIHMDRKGLNCNKNAMYTGISICCTNFCY